MTVFRTLSKNSFPIESLKFSGDADIAQTRAWKAAEKAVVAWLNAENMDAQLAKRGTPGHDVICGESKIQVKQRTIPDRGFWKVDNLRKTLFDAGKVTDVVVVENDSGKRITRILWAPANLVFAHPMLYDNKHNQRFELMGKHFESIAKIWDMRK